MVDARRHFGRDRRLGMEGDAEARRLQHRQVVGAVADGQRSPTCRPRSAQSRSSVASLASLPRIGSSTAPARVGRRAQHVGRLEVEAQRLLHHGGEIGEAARHQGAVGAVLLHGGDQGGAARHVADALGRLVELADRQAASRPTRSCSARGEVELAVHGAAR
jgi:hypothetical protein